jgi:hypothetical protein
VSDGFDDDSEPDLEEAVEAATDRYVDGARGEILQLISNRAGDVFYERQLQVILEKDYYHWIMARAADELADEGKIQSGWMTLPGYGGKTRARFFFSNQLRYWTRKARQSCRLISVYSDPDLTKAVGNQAELLFDAALSRAGFTIGAAETREYNGRRWEESEHDLDRIYLRDGLAYGTEIKNKLAYIEFDELYTKLRIAQHLGLIPLFIARMLPKSWINDVWQRGGFCLIYKYQLYPYGQEKLVQQLREKLDLPIGCPKAIQAGTIQRLMNFHMRRVALV